VRAANLARRASAPEGLLSGNVAPGLRLLSMVSPGEVKLRRVAGAQ
jgi:hypothetical protein